MRILNWVQNKFNGRQEKRRSEVGTSSARHTCVPESRKEEFDDWPESLLSIGTFGNKDTQEEERIKQDSRPSQELPDRFTLEEVKKLQEELTKLLSRRPVKCSSREGSESVEEERANLPLNRFLNCPSSLDVDRTSCEKFCSDLDSNENGEIDISPNTKIMLSKANDLLARNPSAIKQGSLAILLKKILAWRGGFAPSPISLRDPIPHSRMDKILRTVLQKKIYPQTSASMSTKKYLENKPTDKMKHHSKKEEKDEDGCKWVKTDSEYIVLEI
ncbi:protein NEGATIVE GRAVITROPIC RESPONSE OF ROOTS-like [Typha angustifolia]|uniref:protein NEGATIVE GRAVITROPIC RESPONSE OF ROOTS-like n=1 Tax=Typha angustifolia TaxID=59011 RepID=UPI003C2CDC77